MPKGKWGWTWVGWSAHEPWVRGTMGFRAELKDGAVHVDGATPPGVTLGASDIVVVGAPMSVPERWVRTDGSTVRVAERVGDLGGPFDASPSGICQLLSLGAITTPWSALDGVLRLASGDIVTVSESRSGVATSTSRDYLWSPEMSRNDGEVSTTRLRELIAEATDRGVRAVGGDAALMLSSGKDSVALAVALADTGNTQVECFTYASTDDDTEHVYAADLCQRLGLTHHTVTPDDAELTKSVLMRFFEESSQPTADLSITASMLIAERYGYGRGGLMDGIGNDPYMGAMPTGLNRLKWNLRVRNRRVSRTINRRIPVDSGINYFTRSRHGTLASLRMFRSHDIARFYPEAIDADDVWYALDTVEGSDPVAWSSDVRRLLVDGRTLAKAFRTAEAANLTSIVPYRDEATAEYYLHLPEASRIDRRTGTNKVLLRQMLAEAIGYDEAEVGANWFSFDGQRFLIENASWVRDEILGCSLWGSEMEGMLDEWMGALPKRGLLHHSLHALFMVSGWHNHSRYVARP